MSFVCVCVLLYRLLPLSALRLTFAVLVRVTCTSIKVTIAPPPTRMYPLSTSSFFPSSISPYLSDLSRLGHYMELNQMISSSTDVFSSGSVSLFVFCVSLVCVWLSVAVGVNVSV